MRWLVFLWLVAGLAGCTTSMTSEQAIAELYKDGYVNPSYAYGDKYLSANSAKSQDWERFGDWQVKALHDEMDTVTHVRLFTTFNEEDRYKRIDFEKERYLNIGFEIFGGQIVTLSGSSGFIARDYWPFCEMDSATTSIDGKKAIDISTIDMPGSCDAVARDGELIRQFKTGSTARLRIGPDNGNISLKGFSDAWSRALQLSK